MSVEDILVESSNIGTISVSETIGFAKQYDYLRAFGFGERTALDLPDESAGILHPWQKWEGTEKFTVAYGQYIASSPIQLAAAVNTIANDGRYVEPRLVSGIVDADGEVTELPPSATREVVRPEIAEQMQPMMKQVVCRGHGQPGPGARAVDRRQDRHGLHRPARRRVRQGRRHEGLLRQLRRVPAGRGSAGHDPRSRSTTCAPTPRTASAARSRRRCSATWRRRWSTSWASRHRPARRAARSDPDGAGATPSTLGALADVVAGPLGGRIVGDPSVVVSAMTHDSRLVAPGMLFACLRGARTTTVTPTPRPRSPPARPPARRPRVAARRRRRWSSTTPAGRSARSPRWSTASPAAR